jgi:hypothetical protein
MKVNLGDLQSVIDQMLVSIARETEAIDIDVDFYWNVPLELRYDPYSEPSELTMGQLSDDWSELQRIRSGQAEAIPYALVWAAAILRRVGEQVKG